MGIPRPSDWATKIDDLKRRVGILEKSGRQLDPGGRVDTVVAGSNIAVDSSDPANPVVSATAGGGVVETIVAGTNVTVDSTDPANPIVSSTGGGSGIVETIVAGTNVTVDSTDPANPIVEADGFVESVSGGTDITVDNTDPLNPIVEYTGGGGGVVDSVVAGAGMEVDSTDPANPIVGIDPTPAITYAQTSKTLIIARNATGGSNWNHQSWMVAHYQWFKVISFVCDIFQTDTYTLSIDGEDVASAASTGGAAPFALTLTLATPKVLGPGAHVFRMRGTAARRFYYNDTNGAVATGTYPLGIAWGPHMEASVVATFPGTLTFDAEGTLT